MNRYLTKLAVKIHLYEDKTGKKTWVSEAGKVPKNSKLVKTIYKKKKNLVGGNIFIRSGI